MPPDFRPFRRPLLLGVANQSNPSSDRPPDEVLNRALIMSLVYSYAQLITKSAPVSKDYAFKDERSGAEKKGVTHSATLTVLGRDGRVALIKVKGQSLDEVAQRIAPFEVGQAGQIEIRPDIVGGVIQLTA